VRPLAARLAESARVYAPELPGHGASDRDSRPLTLAELGRAACAWIEARGLPPALLVGHSLGGQVAAEAAVLRPDLVAGIVLLGVNSDLAARAPLRQVGRILRGAPFERPSGIALAAWELARSSPAVLLAELRHTVDHRIEELLPRLTVPVRVVRGEHDALLPQRWAEELARLAGAPAPSVVARRAHMLPWDQPGAVSELVVAFARGLADR